MTETEVIDSLKSQHEMLEAKIDREANRPHPDDITIANLKRQKLRIKDQLASLDAL